MARLRGSLSLFLALLLCLAAAPSSDPSIHELKKEQTDTAQSFKELKAKLDALKKAMGPSPSPEAKQAVDAKLIQLHGFRLLLKLQGGAGAWGSANRASFDAALKADLKGALDTGEAGIVVVDVNMALEVVKTFVLPKVGDKNPAEWLKGMASGAQEKALASPLAKVKEACGEACKDAKVQKATVTVPTPPPPPPAEEPQPPDLLLT
jgi:hypothetical protein